MRRRETKEARPLTFDAHGKTLARIACLVRRNVYYWLPVQDDARSVSLCATRAARPHTRASSTPCVARAIVFPHHTYAAQQCLAVHLGARAEFTGSRSTAYMLAMPSDTAAHTEWCIPDSITAARKFTNGCNKNDEWTPLIQPDARSNPVIFIDVGANKGYEICQFLESWAPQIGLSRQRWYKWIRNYADKTKSKHLQWSAGGVCHDKYARKKRGAWRNQPARRVHVHAFEYNSRTSLLLEHLAKAAGLSDMLTVHNQPVTDRSEPVCTKKAYTGYEGGGILKSNCAIKENATSIDDFLQRWHISDVFQVMIDTEGHDSAVLKGMRQTLRARRVRILEFEYSGKWPKIDRDCSATASETCKIRLRTLAHTVHWLWEEARYFCFFHGGDKGGLIPISPPCWRSEFEIRRWSNVLCAHDPRDLALLGNISAAAFHLRTSGSGRTGASAVLTG